ncbi:Pyrimidine-specific ribonucleoside hydrolase RihA [Camellia lanceoleosa]|uniref:Pyrimidine-specific ribonucleoside hydrolase RihA n=1 Tax=Camellia lanceoleosa TaxID=1840588 RepID=A0ACC0I9Z9_9ERIC|nr:Pyrimidine-specific ribonucleoside hydrolase RihA [Camellia lanceoleosa]
MKYSPLQQPIAQQVMIDTVSVGPIVVFLLGSHTNFAIFLMSNPHLKKNIEHIYVMGGAVRPNCPKDANYSSKPEQCLPGSLYPDISNAYAEFSIFGEPFAAYMVLHSGIPVTLVPLDATNTIPISEIFFKEFEPNQNTYEAKYCFQSLKLAYDTCESTICDSCSDLGENEFAEMEYMNITVISSNKPCGISDGLNPFFDSHVIAKFHLQKDGLHSGHVQTGMRDPFCLVHNGKGRCEDGYTKEVTGPEAVLVLVATTAKQDSNVDILKLGEPVIFDMDMSPVDFLALLYLLKLPVELTDLKGILVTSIGWANTATINIAYDELHMMARDDIPVGLGDVLAIGQADPSFTLIGDCKYRQAMPHCSGGFLDSDTLSQRLALDIWKSVIKSLDPGSKITVFTNGPSTTLSQIILFENTSYVIQVKLDITPIPLDIQRSVSSFRKILEKLQLTNKTPEGVFACRLLSRLWHLQQKHHSTITRDSFLSYLHSSGYVLGAEIMTRDNLDLNQTFQSKPLKILAIGDILTDGQITIDRRRGNSVKLLKNVDQVKYYEHFSNVIGDNVQSAVMGSFDKQKTIWSTPHQDQVVS